MKVSKRMTGEVAMLKGDLNSTVSRLALLLPIYTTTECTSQQIDQT